MSKLLAPFQKLHDWLGKKAIMALVAVVLATLREKYGLVWLPDNELLLTVLAMLLAGHTISDVSHLLSLKKTTVDPLP